MSRSDVGLSKKVTHFHKSYIHDGDDNDLEEIGVKMWNYMHSAQENLTDVYNVCAQILSENFSNSSISKIMIPN